MALNTVTLTWDLTDFLSIVIPDSCTLYLTPTFSVADTTDSKTILSQTRSQTFANGVGTLPGIIANDNSSLEPTGSAYTISVTDNTTGKIILGPFTTLINFSNGATQDISFLYSNQVATSSPLFPYVTLSAFNTAIAQAKTDSLQVYSPQLSLTYGVAPLNILSFGADPTGVSDSTAAIQNAINAATGNANPATHSRAPTNSVYAPTGTYKISSDLLIQSVQGFNLVGDGAELTLFKATGTAWTNGPITIDGSYAGRFSGFTIIGDGTEQVTNALTLTWTTGASRSTTGNKIEDIRIRNLNFVTGISLAGVGTRQLDGTKLNNIAIGGNQVANAWSNTGNWQQGIVFGNGSFGNIYDQVMTGVDVNNCYYGYVSNVSGFALYGAQPANNFCEFYILPNAQITVANIQSQSSGQFLIAPANFATAPVTFSDCQMKTNYLSTANNNALITLGGGQWNFNNFSAPNTQITTSVASGSNGGEISQIASWSFPSAGVLDVASVTGLSTSGTAFVATTSGTATITYSGVSAGQLTGCAYVSGSPTGTVATGGIVSSYVNATVSLTGTAGNRPCTVNFSNLTLNNARTTAFALTRASVTISNYINNNPLTGNSTYASGDISSFNYNGTWVSLDTTTVPPTTDVQFFTSNGTWTKPAGAVAVRAICLGGGGGAASGASGASGASVIAGGGGAAGGALVTRDFRASELPASEAITVGAGGAGGAAVTGSSGITAGNSGAPGGSSTFGSIVLGSGGVNATGGTTTSTGGATAYGAVGTSTNGSGASASGTGSTGVSVNGCLVPNGQGGPSAGGITVGGVASNGTSGGLPGPARDSGGSSGGTVDNTLPTTGTMTALPTGAPGPSPGSGAASITTAAQAGANALANSGAGGAGGGASLNGNASGKGGNGGSGWVLVISYF